MTNKEAIETIKIAIAEAEWNYPMDYTVAFEKATEALEKQIPKKPKEVESRELFNPKYPLMAITVTTFNCPCCSEKIMFRTAVKRCLECGQAIDWSEEE